MGVMTEDVYVVTETCDPTGMDCLPLGMHAFLVPLLFCVLNSVVCQQFMQGPYPYPRPGMFLMPGIYPAFNSFERMRQFNDWNQRNMLYPRAWIRKPHRQIVRPRQLFATTQSRVNVNPITRLPIGHSEKSQRNPIYPRTGITNKPKVVTRPPTLITRTRPISKKPKLRSGSLSDVIPHPKQKAYKRLSLNNRFRFRNVAKAKSFSGIIKNTSLEHKRRKMTNSVSK